MAKIKILALDNNTGSPAWRLWPQLRYLQSTGNWEVRNWPARGKKSWEEILTDVAWCDVLFLQSVFDNRIADFAKEHNKKIIFEFDDLIDYVPPTHPMAKQVNTKEWRKEILKVLEMADVCITTNEELKNRFFGLNRNIKIFPNYLDFNFWERPYNPNTSNQIRIGWAGGISHQEDLEWISPVMAAILEKYPQTKFIYCGDGGVYAKDKLTTFIYGTDHFVEIPLNRREYYPGVKIDQWPDRLFSLQLDIAIAPLVYNEFSVCKTPIKVMEFGLNRTPSVAQRFMYGKVITDNVDGLLAGPDKAEWIEKISELVENETKRKQMGEAIYKTIHDKYDLADHYKEWEEIIYS